MSSPPRPPSLYGLYGITPDWPDTARLLAAITQAARGGLRVLQWRRKQGADADLRAQAREVAQHCRALGVVCILNDRWQWLADTGADGVHLGRGDGELATVRRALGDQALIGTSCYADIERARALLAAGADVIAFGALYPSSTKPQAVRAPLGLLRQARALAEAHAKAPAPTTPRPAVVAIGGITPTNAAPVVAAGADAIALIAGLFEAEDIEAAARACAALFAPSSRQSTPP